MYAVEKDWYNAVILEGLCYQHSVELGCRIILPECNPESKQGIHPCREMCYDLRKACSKITLPKSMVSMKIPHNSSDDTTVTLDNTAFDTFDCDIPTVFKWRYSMFL